MLGVISNSDVIALEAEAEERGHAALLEETTVRDVMTPRTLTISPTPTFATQPGRCSTPMCIACSSHRRER